jgi:hypothetical protein
MIGTDGKWSSLCILVENHRLLQGLLALLVGFSIIGVDYLLHPEAGRFQHQVELELRSLPLPPFSSDKDFTSGYQPGKGMASRTIASELPASDLCYFYTLALQEQGWQVEHRYDEPSSDGSNLAVFRRGEVTIRLSFGRDDWSPRRYTLSAFWVR